MTFFDDFGKEVADTNIRASGKSVGDISDLLDHGREPDFPKESLLGLELTVFGIVGPELFPLGPVYFLLIKRKGDAETDDPWGVMFPASSPIVRTTLAVARQNKLPFRGVMERTTSEANPNYQYYNWRRK